MGGQHVRATGGEVGPLLRAEILRLENIPLDEGPGEEYHRHTNLAIQRASAARPAWILGTPRFLQGLAFCIDFVNKCPQLSHRVFRFEWLKFKRLLRATRKNRWSPVKLTDKQFFSKLYRIDEGFDDWGPLVTSDARGGDAGDGGDDRLNHTSMRQAYLRQVLLPEAYFSVPVARALGDGEGEQDAVTQSRFQICSQLYGSKRPKLVETAVKDAEDTARAAAFAVSIQYLAKWRQSSPNNLTCFSIRTQHFVTRSILLHGLL